MRGRAPSHCEHLLTFTHWHWPPTQPNPTNTPQSAHASPQTLRLSGAHAPLQSLKPPLQAMPQEVPLQVAKPFGSVAHAEQLAPQWSTLLFDTQLPLHR